MHSWYETLRNAHKLQQLLDVSVDGEDERGLLGIAVSKNSTVGKTYVSFFILKQDAVHKWMKEKTAMEKNRQAMETAANL